MFDSAAQLTDEEKIARGIHPLQLMGMMPPAETLPGMGGEPPTAPAPAAAPAPVAPAPAPAPAKAQGIPKIGEAAASSDAPAAPGGFGVPRIGERRARDEGELDRLQTTGSGIDQFSKRHPKLGVLARIGDIAGSTLFPGVAEMTPGTTLHHQALVNQSRGRVKEDISEEDTSAQIAERQSKAGKSDKPDSPEQQYIDDFIARNPGKTVADAVKAYAQDTSHSAGNESPQQGYAQAIADAIKRGVNPAHDPHVQAWKEAIGALGDNKPDSPAKEDINDYIAANNLEDTPANREKARAEIAKRAPQARISVFGNPNAAPAGEAGAAVRNVPEKMRGEAIKEFSKAGQDYVGAQQAASDMKTFIDLARSGNKMAYAYAPVEGVLTLNTGRGVKRVNMSEITSYAGAGSAKDRILGFFGKQTQGASIPPQILKDMESLHQTIAGNARSAYENHVKVLNHSYGAEFKPVELGEGEQGGGRQRPANVPEGFIYKANGPKGPGWYKP